jgi:hypothetical protein
MGASASPRIEAAAAATAVLGGVVIEALSSRPGFDDTGIAAGLLVVVAFAVALVSGRRPWLWGVLVGAWVPLVELVQNRNVGSLLAIVFALAGAVLGVAARRVIDSSRNASSTERHDR